MRVSAAQAAKPLSAWLQSAQDRMEGQSAKAAALRADRDRLLSQVEKLDAEAAETDAAVRECIVELEPLHREARPAEPHSAAALLRQILESGHAQATIAALSRAVAAGAG